MLVIIDGIIGVFSIMKYLNYEKPGEYGDEKSEKYRVWATRINVEGLTLSGNQFWTVWRVVILCCYRGIMIMLPLMVAHFLNDPSQNWKRFLRRKLIKFAYKKCV